MAEYSCLGFSIYMYLLPYKHLGGLKNNHLALALVGV